MNVSIILQVTGKGYVTETPDIYTWKPIEAKQYPMFNVWHEARARPVWDDIERLENAGEKVTRMQMTISVEISPI